MSGDEGLETRIEVQGVPARMLMALDLEGHRRFLRCDEDGFLLCKVISVEEADLEVADE